MHGVRTENHHARRRDLEVASGSSGQSCSEGAAVIARRLVQTDPWPSPGPWLPDDDAERRRGADLLKTRRLQAGDCAS